MNLLLKLFFHRFLSLVEDASLYAFLRDSAGTTVSLPPVTNSETSKVRLVIMHHVNQLEWQTHSLGKSFN